MTVSEEALGAAKPDKVLLRVRSRGCTFTFAPRPDSSGSLVFDVPMNDELRKLLPSARFTFDNDRKRGWYLNNGGYGFGGGIQWQLLSPNVEAELGVVAARRRGNREGVSKATVAAVSQSPYKPRGVPLAFGNVRSSTSANFRLRYRVFRPVPIKTVSGAALGPVRPAPPPAGHRSPQPH